MTKFSRIIKGFNANNFPTFYEHFGYQYSCFFFSLLVCIYLHNTYQLHKWLIRKTEIKWDAVYAI